MRLGRGAAGGSIAGFMRNSALAWVVLVVTVVATFFAWRFAVMSVENRAEHEFLEHVGDADEAISNRMVDYNIALTAPSG